MPVDPLDGIDLVNHLRQQSPNLSRTLFWRQRRGEQTWRGVRHGDLKLVSRQQADQREQWLFNLASDQAEKTDLTAARPADLAKLNGLLATWEEQVKPTR